MSVRPARPLTILLASLALLGCDVPASTSTPPDDTPREPSGDTSPPERSSESESGGGTAPTAPNTPPRGPEAVVASVTDGDTIRLRGGARVRLVQVDTPEVRGGVECGGRAASDALASQLPTGTRVRLVPEPAGDRVDRYGRLLRYVYRGDRNLNVWLVRHGHAAPYYYDGIRGRFAAQLDRAARAARAERRGFWGRCPNAVLDAYRGLDTGRLAAANAPSDAARGASTLGAGAGLPLQPAGGPDVDCGHVDGPVRVTPGDPHRLDADGDGIGCDG